MADRDPATVRTVEPGSVAEVATPVNVAKKRALGP